MNWAGAIIGGCLFFLAAAWWLTSRWTPPAQPPRGTADMIREQISTNDIWGVMNNCGCHFRRDGTWEDCPAHELLTEMTQRADQAMTSPDKGAP